MEAVCLACLQGRYAEWHPGTELDRSRGLENFCYLDGSRDHPPDVKLLCPIPIPFWLISKSLSRAVAFFSPVHDAQHRGRAPAEIVGEEVPSVSVIVPARNESGNIDNILARCPMMGPQDEIISSKAIRG